MENNEQDAKSISTAFVLSQKMSKSSYSIYSVLEKQLEIERVEREKLQKEINELKLVNEKLCEAIFNVPPKKNK